MIYVTHTQTNINKTLMVFFFVFRRQSWDGFRIIVNYKNLKTIFYGKV